MTQPGTDELLATSAIGLALLVRRKKVSPVELVEAFTRRIEAENPEINAVVADRFELARDEAKAATERLAKVDSSDELPPFFGVPCTIKEGIAVEGMPNSAGVFARKHIRADRDAVVVRRLRDAGAIVLGVTNMAEGGMWLETDNRVYGRTTNPWDLSRIPGGSSGGEAAILATGASPFGIGSDIGGSIRIPAAFCGIFGHKPSGKLVPNAGYWPDVPGALDEFLCTGPMTRSAEDLWPVLDVMSAGKLEGHPDDIDLREVTVYPVEEFGSINVRPEARRAVRRASVALQTRGARVAELRTRGLDKSFLIWSAMMEEEAAGLEYTEVLGNGERISVVRELLRWRAPDRRHTIQALIVAAVDSLAKRIPAPIATYSRAGKQLRADLEAELGPRGVLLCPPYSRAAPRHFEPLRTPFDFVCTAIFNSLGFPVTQVPVGFDAAGLPLGVQVAGRRGADALTIAVARALEVDLGGFTRARRPSSARTTR
jgi:fatty acid amide hydrolase 2